MTEKNSIYQDIAKRTGGDIYIGVVGPVRTGKSTFIKRFMENLILPKWKTAPKKVAPPTKCHKAAAEKT